MDPLIDLPEYPEHSMFPSWPSEKYHVDNQITSIILYLIRHRPRHQSTLQFITYCSNGASFYDRTQKYCASVHFTIGKKTVRATCLSVLYRTHFILVWYNLSDVAKYMTPPNQTTFINNVNSMKSHFIPCRTEDPIRINRDRHQTHKLMN